MKGSKHRISELERELEIPILASELLKEKIDCFEGYIERIRVGKDRHGRPCVTAWIRILKPDKYKDKVVVVNWNRLYLRRYVLPFVKKEFGDDVALEDLTEINMEFCYTEDKEFEKVAEERGINKSYGRFIPVKVLEEVAEEKEGEGEEGEERG